MLAVDEAANLRVSEVTYVAGLFCTVEVMVSRELAVRYVPPYSMQMSAKGFEKTRLWGRRTKDVRDSLRESFSVACPEAFCIIPLYTELAEIFE
jgi:hypothetical protein